MILSRNTLRARQIRIDEATCILCQWRTFSTSFRPLAQKSAPKKAAPKPPTPTTTSPGKDAPAAPPSIPIPAVDAPKSYGKAHEKFEPKPLPRPIGLPYPPRAGENTGIDKRTLRQRRDDFVDYDKHLVRRKELTHKVASPYFREWDNMRFSKGKSFIAPPNIFKSDVALYFPNLRGQTLLKDRSPKDTTPALEDRISIVSIFSTRWAENQTRTFVSDEKNKELHEVVRSSKGLAQMAQINLEENWMKAMLVKLFMPGLRKQFEESAWGRYFLIRKGFKQEMKEAMGLLNTKVGYIYVLDGQCRIRWAGSGNSSDGEKEGLVKAVRKLIEQSKARNEKTSASPKKMVEARNNKKPVTTAAFTV